MSRGYFQYVWLEGLLLLLAAAGCGKGAQAAGGDSNQPPALAVKIEVAKLERVGDYTEYLATMKSRSSSVLQPQVEGQIVQIYVKSGDQVTAGTPILEIDPLKQQATVHNQEANRRAKVATLDLARVELERRKKLYAEGVTSKQDLDQAQTAYDAAKADVDATEAGVREQQAQLHYYTVRAPAAGTIGDIPVRVGDRVATTTVLTTMDKGGELEAYISIPSEKSGAVKLGTPVEILADDGKPPVRSRVTFVSPRVDPDTQLLLIKAVVPNTERRFRNEQVVHAHVIWSELDVPVIPVTAVARVSGQMFAYVAESNGKQLVARQRGLRLGDVVNNNYIVLDGIKPGDKVIVTGVQMLADGIAVTPSSQ